jgi:transcriptional regulator with XRE-family HTH domain
LAGLRKNLEPFSQNDSIGGRIARLAIARDISITAIMKGTGISETTIWRAVKENSISKFSNIQKIADYFKVSIEWLQTGKETTKSNIIEYEPPALKKVKQVPLYGAAICGIPLEDWDSQRKKMLEVDFIHGTDIKNTFAVEATGMSMSQTIMPGWIMFAYRPTNLPHRKPDENYTVKDLKKIFKPMQLVVVSFKTFPETSKGAIKRINYIEEANDRIELLSDNLRNFPPIVCRLTDIYEIFAVYPKFIGEIKIY